MSFNVSADAYLRFMERYSEPLAARFADLAGIRHGQRALDVGCGPVAAFWRAVREVDPAADDESGLAGVREGDLARLGVQAGLGEVRAGTLAVRARYAAFDDWWEPFTLGVGPAGDYVASLDAERRGLLRQHCRRLLPAGSFEITATSWAVTGRA